MSYNREMVKWTVVYQFHGVLGVSLCSISVPGPAPTITPAVLCFLISVRWTDALSWCFTTAETQENQPTKSPNSETLWQNKPSSFSSCLGCLPQSWEVGLKHTQIIECLITVSSHVTSTLRCGYITSWKWFISHFQIVGHLAVPLLGSYK